MKAAEIRPVASPEGRSGCDQKTDGVEMVGGTLPPPVSPLVLLIPNRWPDDQAGKILSLKGLSQATVVVGFDTTILIQERDPFRAQLPSQFNAPVETTGQTSTIAVDHDLNTREKSAIANGQIGIVVNHNHGQSRLQKRLHIGSNISGRILTEERNDHNVQRGISLAVHLPRGSAADASRYGPHWQGEDTLSR